MGAADESSGDRTQEQPRREGQGNEGVDSEAVDEVDEWGRESFPASDPPAAWSGPNDT